MKDEEENAVSFCLFFILHPSSFILARRRSMSATETELRPLFRRRFRAVTRQIWSLHVGRGVARTTVAVVALLAALAAADYFFELSWLARASLLAACTVVVAWLVVRWIVRPA